MTVSTLRWGGGGGGGAVKGREIDLDVGVVGEVTAELEGLDPDEDWRLNSRSCCVAFLVCSTFLL